MLEVKGKTFNCDNKKKTQLLEEINEFIKSLYINEKESDRVKNLLLERGVDKIVFRDKDNKLSPIQYGDINIIGVLVSKSGVVWLVDDSKIRSDINGSVRENYYTDKHCITSFTKDFKDVIIKKIINND